MTTSLTTGLTGESRRTVTDEVTAVRLGSGDVNVFGTPALLALLEEAAVAAVRGALQDDTTSVGTWVELEHRAPSRVGAEVRGIARLIHVDGRTLTFECEAYDGETLIGTARHRRAIVSRARFGS
ncbi:MAG TPA: hotdog domain-containing protein [Actinomycetota bacterium]|nr:hotdog domain-containing protein [Actinomycetota bacterium]